MFMNFHRLCNTIGCHQCFVDLCLFFRLIFFWSLYCLSFFDLWILIIPLVSSLFLVESELCHATVEYFGRIVGQGQINPITAKVEAILNFPKHKSKRELM